MIRFNPSKSEAVVVRCFQKRSGDWHVVAKLMNPPREVTVIANDPIEEGARITLTGAGALWELAA